MSRRKHPAPAVAIALATAIVVAPFASADQSTGTPAFSAAASLASPGPGSLRLASMVDSSRRTTALDYARFEANWSQDTQPAPATPSGGWSSLGKKLTIAGVAVAAVGGVMVAAGSDQEYEEGFNIDWKTTGYIWIGAGVVLAIVGLTRRD